jgi:hypothetical protein
MQLPSVPNWPTVMGALVGALGLAFAILRAGASRVRAETAAATTAASALTALSASVQRIETRMDDYIRDELDEERQLRQWRLDVDRRLGEMEGAMQALVANGRRYDRGNTA